MLERAIAIFTTALGTDHSNLGYSLAGLAGLDHQAGDLDSAERGFRRALEVMEKGLGPDHPDVAEVRRSYAALLRDLGREAEAAEQEQRAAGKPQS